MGKIGTRTLVAGFLLGAGGVFAILSGLILWQSFHDTRARIHAQALGSAHVVATHVDWIVGASRQALQQIDDLIGPTTDVSEDARRRMRDIVEELPARVGGGLIDAEGVPVFSTQGDRLDVPVADRDYFLALKAGGPAVVVTPLMVDRATKTQVFLIARRIERAGQFAGLAFITVPATVMADLLQPLNLGPGSTVSVFRTDGWLVARYPLPDGPMNLANYVLFTEHLPKRHAGTYDAVSPADGIVRVVGYRKVENEPLLGLASLATETQLAPFWTQAGWFGATLALLLAALGFIVYYLLEVLRRDERSRLALSSALQQNRLLLQEIHHRVKNNLQAVASLMQLAPMDAQVKQAMSLRLAAMAAIHEQAYGSDEYADVLLPEYLSRLIDKLRQAYGADVDVEAVLEPIVVDRDQALPLGLIANEVLSNAFKHAFPSGQRGKIELRLRNVDDGRIELEIRDNGVGLDPVRPGSGMGTRLVTGLVMQLGGEAETASSRGTSFRLRFPVRRRPGIGAA